MSKQAAASRGRRRQPQHSLPHSQDRKLSDHRNASKPPSMVFWHGTECSAQARQGKYLVVEQSAAAAADPQWSYRREANLNHLLLVPSHPARRCALRHQEVEMDREKAGVSMERTDKGRDTTRRKGGKNVQKRPDQNRQEKTAASVGYLMTEATAEVGVRV